jgi:hypothetical protein
VAELKSGIDTTLEIDTTSLQRYWLKKGTIRVCIVPLFEVKNVLFGYGAYPVDKTTVLI